MVRPSWAHGARIAGRAALRSSLAVSLLLLALVGIVPLTGWYRCVTVLTASMRPTMAAGSVVISTPEPPSAVRVGQVITFQAPVEGHPVVTHRVVEVVSRGRHPRVRTQGDANPSPDPWVARLATGPVWKARAELRGLGTVIRALRSPWVHRLSVLVAPAVFLGLALGAIWGPDRGRQLGGAANAPIATGPDRGAL